MSSERSFKLCGDDADTTAVTSYSKRNRLSQLSAQQNRNTCAGSLANPPETDQLILDDSTKETPIDDSSTKAQDAHQSPVPSKLSLNLNQPIASGDSTNQATTSDTSNTQLKNMSKAAVLRHLFFSQISSNANAAEPTSNLASSKETN